MAGKGVHRSGFLRNIPKIMSRSKIKSRPRNTNSYFVPRVAIPGDGEFFSFPDHAWENNIVEITVTDAGEVKVVRIECKLDTQSSPDAQAQLTQLIDQGATKLVGRTKNP